MKIDINYNNKRLKQTILNMRFVDAEDFCHDFLDESEITESEIKTNVDQFNKISIFWCRNCIPVFKIGCD